MGGKNNQALTKYLFYSKRRDNVLQVYFEQKGIFDEIDSRLLSVVKDFFESFKTPKEKFYTILYQYNLVIRRKVEETCLSI